MRRVTRVVLAGLLVASATTLTVALTRDRDPSDQSVTALGDLGRTDSAPLVETTRTYSDGTLIVEPMSAAKYPVSVPLDVSAPAVLDVVVKDTPALASLKVNPTVEFGLFTDTGYGDVAPGSEARGLGSTDQELILHFKQQPVWIVTWNNAPLNELFDLLGAGGPEGIDSKDAPDLSKATATVLAIVSPDGKQVLGILTSGNKS